LAFEELFDLAGMTAEERGAFSGIAALAMHCGGWQSWSAGWELCGAETLPRKVRLIPELITLTNGPLEPSAPGPKAERTGHFIMYLRACDRYLCAASLQPPGLPPVRFRVNIKERRIIFEALYPKERGSGVIAEIAVFYAFGFFALKDALKALYQQGGAFARLQFLSAPAARLKDAVPGGYGSWYNRYTAINEDTILKDLAGLGKTGNFVKLWYLDRGKPAVFQIDDGWEQAVGEWTCRTARFPRGLAPLAQAIEQAGMAPGIWIAPFIVTRKAAVFREKPEWILRDAAGKAVPAGFNHLWDGRYYALDLSRKEVLDYLASLMDTVAGQWGFRYIKIDFLYAGMLEGAFHRGGTPWEHYQRACGVLTAGNAAYLGCGAPLGLSFRHFPLCRIGADTRGEWDWRLPRVMGHVGRPSAYINLMDTIGRSFLDGAVYLNDPDVIFLRNRRCALSETEKELIALANFLLAGQLMISDDPCEVHAEEAAFTQRILRLYDDLADDEYGAVRIDREVFRVESRSGAVTGLINLRGRAYALAPETAPRLFEALDQAELLVDRRIKRGLGGSHKKNALLFSPHSITLSQTP
jgi:alpha-galactosidase